MKSPLALAIYLGIVLLLVCAQYTETRMSMDQIRYEELAESVRNVWWLDHHTMYDGVSSNIGWYGTLLACYKVFGFDIHTAKYVRLFLSVVCCISLAVLLCRFLGPRYAWIALLTIGLSPTLLYLNTMQAGYGIDLEYAPLCLLLALSIRPDTSLRSLLSTFSLWLVATIASMSYPTFLPYVPFLACISFMRIKDSPRLPATITVHSLIAVGGVCLPFAAALAYLKDFGLLINDPVTGAGLFRGGGGLVWSETVYLNSLTALFNDLFVHGGSYHFELAHVELPYFFADPPVVLLLAAIGIAVGKERQLRGMLVLAGCLGILDLTFPDFSKGLPGIRRNTAVLVSFYAIFVLFLKYLAAEGRYRTTKICGVIACLCLLGHHAAAYYANLTEPRWLSPESSRFWFNVKGSPRASLQFWLRAAEECGPRVELVARDSNGRPMPCRYPEIYAALAGYWRWNKLEGRPIVAWDWRTDRFVPLSVELWEARRGHSPENSFLRPGPALL